MKKLWPKAKLLLANPVVHPVEVWLVRAVVVYVAAKLGVGVDHLVK